ncbi:hypothetical protein C8R47DRAFT_1063604 [Mycena vitilis]|nr:hypothetical protein C8R47DRAFT_1063604 [Mycena vitilis]
MHGRQAVLIGCVKAAAAASTPDMVGRGRLLLPSAGDGYVSSRKLKHGRRIPFACSLPASRSLPAAKPSISLRHKSGQSSAIFPRACGRLGSPAVWGLDSRGLHPDDASTLCPRRPHPLLLLSLLGWDDAGLGSIHRSVIRYPPFLVRIRTPVLPLRIYIYALEMCNSYEIVRHGRAVDVLCALLQRDGHGPAKTLKSGRKIWRGRSGFDGRMSYIPLTSLRVVFVRPLSTSVPQTVFVSPTQFRRSSRDLFVRALTKYLHRRYPPSSLTPGSELPSQRNETHQQKMYINFFDRWKAVGRHRPSDDKDGCSGQEEEYYCEIGQGRGPAGRRTGWYHTHWLK